MDETVEWFAKEIGFCIQFQLAGTEAIGLQSLTSSRHTRTRNWVSWSMSYMLKLSVPKGSENMVFVDASKIFKIFWYTSQEHGLQHPCGFPAGHKDFSVHGTIILIFATAYQEPKSVFATNI